MTREYPDHPFVGVGAVVININGDRALLIRRGTAPQRGEWSLPGGVLECGETLRAAVAREVCEETGLLVEVGEMLGVYERIILGDVSPGDDRRVRFHYVLIDFLCRPLSGELKAGSDAADARWFAREELPALNLTHDANDVIGKGLDRA